MGKSRKTITIVRFFGYVLVGSAVASKALASAVMSFLPTGQAEPPAVWPKIRGEMEQPRDDRSLHPNLVNLVQNAAFDESFRRTIRLSYSMVSINEVNALDKLWIDTLIRNAGSDTIEVFLSVRASIDELGVQDGNGYLESWVWRTSSRAGSST